MAASSPGPGVCPGRVVDVLGIVVEVAPMGTEPGRHTSWYLSSSAPLVVEAWAWIMTLPLRSSPFLFGPTIGTTKSTGAERVVGLDGNPIPAPAASRPL